MRKVLYVIPYFYDEADEAWPMKYVNDIPGIVGSRALAIRTRPDRTPIDGDIEVNGTDAAHAELAAKPDVTVLRDPA